MQYLAYDIEIIKCIPYRGQQIYNPRYEYASGWESKDLGISVIGLANDHIRTAICPTVRPYWQEELTKIVTNPNYTLVGFNNHGFDDQQLAHLGYTMPRSYDLLKEVRLSAWGGTDFRAVPRGLSYKLDKIAMANGMAKSGKGEDAAMLWQDGQHREVIDYCLNDAKITYQLWMLLLQGELIDPNTGNKLSIHQGAISA